MSQKTLDGKTKCRKGHAKVRFTGKNPTIIADLKEIHKKCPCISVSINGEKLEEKPIKWQQEPRP